MSLVSRRSPPSRIFMRFLPLLLAALVALAAMPDSAHAQRPVVKLPTVVASGWNEGAESPLPSSEDDLRGLERSLRQQFAQKDAPDELLTLVRTSASDLILVPWVEPRDVVDIFLYGERGELRLFTDWTTERYFWRSLSPEEVRSIRSFVANNNLDGLRSLDQRRLVHGRPRVYVHGGAYVLFHMNAVRGRRTIIFNPPRHDEGDGPSAQSPLWQYTKVVEFFEQLTNAKGLAVRYCLARPVPGMEVVYADPKNDIRAVWKREGRLCVTVGKHGLTPEEPRALRNGELAEPVPPPDLTDERVELVGNLRARTACESSDGRWALGLLDAARLACFDRHGQTFLDLDKEVQSGFVPLNYVEPRHAFLLARFSAVMVGEQLLFRPTAFRLLDPEAGKSSEVPADALGESVEGAYEPWLQPLPRKLQKADGANASVVWLSTLGEDGTCVGRYDTRSFRWVTEQWIPGLRVRAKDIWVDEEDRRIYFIYQKQLLAVPLCRQSQDKAGRPTELTPKPESPAKSETRPERPVSVHQAT